MNPRLFYPYGPLQNQNEKTDVIYFANCGRPHTVVDQAVLNCDDWIDEASDDEIFKIANSYQQAVDIRDGLKYIAVADDPILNRPGYVSSLPLMSQMHPHPTAAVTDVEEVRYAERNIKKHMLFLQRPKRKAVFL